MHELTTAPWMDEVDELGCGALIMDLEGKILVANTHLDEWVGPAVGRLLPTVMARGSAIYWETAVMPVLATQGSARDVALELEGKAGPVPVVLFARRQGEGTHCLMVPFHDRSRYNRMLAEAQDRIRRHTAEMRRLRDLDRLRSDFINSLAHELSTPMTPLTIQIDLVRRLAEQRDDPALAKAMHVMGKNLKQLQHFHQSLVTAAELQGRSLGIDAKPVRLDALASDVTKRWLAKHQPDRVVTQSWGPCAAVADKTALASCVEHVLDNALRFSSAGDRIRVGCTSDGVVFVKDDGRGIEKGRLAHLGKPFAKADPEETQLGVGLGLYIVAGLMKAQGGTFRILSDGPGLGAEVQLQFRLDDGKRPPRPSRAPTKA